MCLASRYHGAVAALATRHGKARAIAPAMAEALGLGIIVPAALDTDSLGTFTGEVPRPAPMRETARLKARMGMTEAGLPLGIASEGSFGPHPAVPFLAAAHELMIFIDDAGGFEIAEEQISAETNFAALEVTPDADLEGFLARAGFPSHALIFRSGGEIVKGIVSREHLDALLRRAEGPVRLETDMRAHFNPTRMAEIARLAAKLAQRIATPCPGCGAPGFGLVRSETGLPCAVCGAPTGLVRQLVFGCQSCGHEEIRPRPDARQTATPAQCPECNP
jgi:hypothetical protein